MCWTANPPRGGEALWLQKLHRLGLLNGSFRPDAEMVALRTYLPHRAELIQHHAPHILHMQKALQQMNLQLLHVLSDITGVTGQAIVRAIVAGERDPKTLATFRQPGCKADEPTLIKALTGSWRPEHLFVLNAASTRQELFRIIGVDLVAVTSLSPSLAQTIIAEIGTDMSRFTDAKHFCSWLGLAPHNDITGGKILHSHTLKTANRAGQAFRQAAAAVVRSNSAFGAFFRLKRTQLGPAQALVTTAHKIVRTVYFMLKYKVAFDEIGAQGYETQQRPRELTHLHRKAAKLGLT